MNSEERELNHHAEDEVLTTCGRNVEFFANYMRLVVGELDQSSPEIREMFDAGVLIGSTEEAKTNFNEAEIAQVLEETRKNPYWREVYDTAPSEGCKRWIALSFYYSEYWGECDKINKADMLLERRRLEATYTIADYKHLGRHCGNNPLHTYYYGKAKELEALESENDDE